MDTGSQDYRNQSMFLDGPVLDGIAVCDGLTKEIVVLSRLMGIESYHIGARDAMSGHAYVYANVDGTWYLSCPTSGIERYPLTDTEWQSYHTSNFMLTDFDTNMPSWAYDSDAFEDTIEAEMLKNTVTEDYWSNTALSLGGKSVTLHPGSLEEALLVLRYAHALQSVLKMPVEAELCGSVDVLRDAYDTLKAEGISVAYLSGGTFEGQRLQVYLFDGKDGESGASGEKAKEAEDKSKDAKEHSEGTKETIEDEKEQHEDAEKKAKVSAEEWDKFRNGKTFASDLEEEALPRPKEVLTCLDDFVYAMDYLAFYRVSGSVFFSFSDEYAESFFNPYTEYQKAYLHSDLADVYPCQMDDSYFSKYGVISVKYSISKDVASAAPKQLPDTPAVPSFDYENENTAGDAALRIDTADLEEIPCENSEQLYYLAMNGFRPVPVDGSVAEELYEKAVEVLASIIREDMSDFEKIKAVYDYLTTEVRYDYATAYSEDTYLVKEQAYYLEGVFFNHTAVCDGKAKAYALMLNMLGIPCYRDTGTSEGGDHAWNVVQLDGKWYISCTTYGQGNAGESLGRLLPNYATLLAGSMTPYGEEGWGFRSQKHTDVTELLEEEAYDVYGAMSVSSGETLKVGSMEDTRSMLEHIEKEHTREYKVEFMYTGEDIEGYQDELVSYLETLDHVNAVPVVSETDPVYQVLYLK